MWEENSRLRGEPGESIAMWDGTSWSALGSGMVTLGHCVRGERHNVYVGGAFTTAGGTPANRIAKWNGTCWSSLGSGMNDVVSALAASGTNLYAGGLFTDGGRNACSSYCDVERHLVGAGKRSK